MPGLDPQRQLRDIQRYLEHKRAFEARGGRASTTTLQVTFLERNSEELPRLLCWAMDNGMDRFKGHHLWVTWPQLADQSLRRSGESIARWNHMVMVLRALAASTTRPDGSTIRLENIDPLPTASSPGTSGPTRCPFAGREAWVEADGSFQVCCCPSPLRRAFGDFGSLHETPFMEIWRSHRYRDFVASWGDHPNCRDCALRRPVQETDHA